MGSVSTAVPQPVPDMLAALEALLTAAPWQLGGEKPARGGRSS